MTWDNVLGHQRQRERFARALAAGRMASTWLFVGPEGIGKKTFAITLAQGLLCESNDADSIDPCGRCPACQQVLAATHPDLIQIGRPDGKAFIPLELLIGKPDHRRQSGLCHDIGMKPFRGGRKVAIIDDADYLNIEGANSLLKTLEEPPADSVLILIGRSEFQQLPTIVSRSQVVRFEPLATTEVNSVLDRLAVECPHPNSELAAVSGGSVSQALSLTDPLLLEFRNQLISKLASTDPPVGGFVKEVDAFLKTAGKDSASQRNRLMQLGDWAIEFFHSVIHRTSDPAWNIDDDHLERYVADVVARFPGDAATVLEIAAASAETTVRMQRQVRSNAATVGVLEIWLRDLGRCGRKNVIGLFEIDA